MPVLKVRLGRPHDLWTPRFGAVVDSGSPPCMFPTAMADFLGIKATDGVETIVGGILKGTTEPIYFHSLKLQSGKQLEYYHQSWVCQEVSRGRHSRAQWILR